MTGEGVGGARGIYGDAQVLPWVPACPPAGG